MQVGQILQTLAVAPFERPPSHLEYFYSQFDQVISFFSVFQLIIFVGLGKKIEEQNYLFRTLWLE